MRTNRLTALIMMLCMLCSMLPLTAFAAEKEPVILHVSANARSGGNGSEDAPFRTIEAAQTALRSKNHKNIKTEVIIHGGTYHFDKSLQFNSQDSGTEGYPVVYKAAGDGEVIFTGSTKLDVMSFTAVNDKVTLNRLPKTSRDKVGVLDLAPYNLNKDMLSISARYTESKTAPPFVYLYLNDKRQSMARWPNVGFETIVTVRESGEAAGNINVGKRGCFNYNTMQPEKWLMADQAYIQGYLGSEYCLDLTALDKVDTESKTITVANPTNYGIKPGHRWYVTNLLEEIDCPGEFFIDVNAMKLYFYPPQKLNSDDELELTVYNDKFIKVNDASHIEFNGMHFQHTLSNGIEITNSSNITIRGCKMNNIGMNGIVINGSKNLVEACTIYETGRYGIQLKSGGDPETLTPSANRVANNHLYNFATSNNMLYKTAVDLGRESANKIIGDIVEHNIIHGQPNAYGIIYGGVDNIIRYNELYCVTNDAADMGVIYCGRRLREFGNLIEYNYIHDYAPNFSARYQIQGIYWDDLQSGQTAKHNIIVAGNKNRTAGDLIVGAYNNFSENVVVNSDLGVRMTDRVGNVSTTAYNSLSGDGVTAALLQKYPQMTKLKEQLDRDNMFFNVQDNILENNLSVDVNSNSIHDNVIARAISIKNNQITDDYSVFVDAANHDYRLTAEAMELFGFPDTMVNENNFDMDNIGIQPEVFDVETPETEFYQLYPTNGQKDVIRNNAFLKWEEALFADKYEWVVATDPELKNVVASGETQYTFAQLDNLENSTTYYYKVRAKNLSKQIGNEWDSEGVPYMFTTSDSDELEKNFLNEEIKNIKELKASIQTGDSIGEFKPEVMDDIDDAIDKAEAISAMVKGSQSDIDNGVSELKKFMDLINGYKYSGHAALNVNKDWLTYSENTVVTPTEKGAKFESLGSGFAYLNAPVNNYESQHFRMKINFSGWTGITLRQKDETLMPYSTSNNTYLVIFKPDVIEFQKYNSAASTTGIINTFTNSYVKDGMWHDIEFGAVDVKGGVEIILKVDGEKVFSYYDTETPNVNEGYFTLFPGSAGAVVELELPDTIPEGFYEFIGETAAATVYGSDAQIYKSEGTWYDSAVKSVNNTPIKLSDDAGAKASYTITDTNTAYRISYYHRPIEGADNNETVTVSAYSPTTGTTYHITRKVDFSSGEQGWIDLGVHECASASQIGTIVVEFQGSGEGSAAAPVISAEKVTAEELALSRALYENGDNLLVMQIANSKAYRSGAAMNIPDVAPYIDNSITLVPLRFVAEAFDAKVVWDNNAQKAIISDGKTIIEFTLGNKVYTVNDVAYNAETEPKLVNGRTMVPLRATAESLGKTVLWYNDKSMIFIADSLGFGETDTDKMDIMAKAFE